MQLIERLSDTSPPAFGAVVAGSSFVVYTAAYAVAHAAGVVETGVADAVWRGAVIGQSVLGAGRLAWDKGRARHFGRQ